MTTTSPVSDIVEVTATISSGISQGADFGRVMLLSADARIGLKDRIQSFSQYATIERKYPGSVMLEPARAYFSQIPAPPPLNVGKWFKEDQASIIRGTNRPTLGDLTDLGSGYTLTVNGNTATTGTLGGAANFAAVATVLQTAAVSAVTGSTVVYNATSGSFDIGLPAGTSFTTNPTGTIATLIGWDTAEIANGILAETITDALTAVETAGDFYWTVVGPDTTASSDILAVADWVIAREGKYFIYEANGVGGLTTGDTTSVFARLFAKGSDRVQVVYGSVDDGKDIAIAGKFSSIDFNGFNTLLNIHGQDLPGTMGDNLTEAQIAEIRRKNGTFYHRWAGGGIVFGGRSTSGQFVDVVYALDWMKVTVANQVFDSLRRSNRVAHTVLTAASIIFRPAAVCATRLLLRRLSNTWLATVTFIQSSA